MDAKSLSNCLCKLMGYWRHGRCTVLLYSACNTVGFSDLQTEDKLKKYINDVTVDMIYIKTSKSEAQIYVSDVTSYRFFYKLSTLYINTKYDLKLRIHLE